MAFSRFQAPRIRDRLPCAEERAWRSKAARIVGRSPPDSEGGDGETPRIPGSRRWALGGGLPQCDQLLQVPVLPFAARCRGETRGVSESSAIPAPARGRDDRTAWFPQHFRLSFGSSGPSCQPHRCHQPERTTWPVVRRRRDGQTPTSPRGAASQLDRARIASLRPMRLLRAFFPELTGQRIGLWTARSSVLPESISRSTDRSTVLSPARSTFIPGGSSTCVRTWRWFVAGRSGSGWLSCKPGTRTRHLSRQNCCLRENGPA